MPKNAVFWRILCQEKYFQQLSSTFHHKIHNLIDFLVLRLIEKTTYILWGIHGRTYLFGTSHWFFINFYSLFPSLCYNTYDFITFLLDISGLFFWLLTLFKLLYLYITLSLDFSTLLGFTLKGSNHEILLL